MQFNITKIIEENKNLVDTKYIYNKTFKRFEEKTGENWSTNVANLKKIISEPTGFSLLNNETDIYSSIISFSIDGSRILSITPANEHFIFYVNGKEFIKTDVSQVQIPDIQGIHYVYFNENGVLEARTDFSLQDIMKKYASVATIYWDYINKKVIYIGDKRHSINSDAYQNYLNFINDKTVDYVEGTNIKFTNNIDGSVNDKVDGDGSSNYHTSFAIESGKYRNYDLLNNSEHIEFSENIPIFYKQTISQEKNWIAMASKPDGNIIVAISDDGEYRIMTSLDQGETWEKIYLPFYSTWEDIIYAQNKFIAVASSGTYSIISSSDGINWSSVIVPQKNRWQSITYGNGLFVVVGLDGNNRVMTSNNGSLWIIRETPNLLPLKKVKFIPSYDEENAKFIAVSEDDIFLLSSTQQDVQAYSKAFISEDAITWENINISENKGWNTITFGNGRFVALAISGRNKLLNTSNINIWGTYELSNNVLDSQNWVSNIYAFGNHMAVSNSGTNRFIRSSNNGLTWESLDTLGESDWRKITFNQSYVLAVAANGTNRTKYSSNNGTSWTSITNNDTRDLEDAVYGEKWVLVASEATNGGRIVSSSDLSTWSTVTSRDNVRWKGIAYNSNTYVAVGSDDNSWKLSTAAANNDWRSVIYAASLFIAVSSTGTTVSRVMTSPNGINWTIRSASEANSWQSLVSNGTTIVAVSTDGTNRVMTSTNGTSWVARMAAQQNSWRSVTWGANKFVAVASDGTNRVMYSADGQTWNTASASQENEWYGVTFGNNLFVAVAVTGTNRVMTSSDGITWISRNAISDSSWGSIAYGGVFVAVSVEGKVMTSIDGIDWQETGIVDIATPVWTNVSYVNGNFIVVGPGSEIIISSNGLDWEIRDAAGTSGWNSTAFGNNTYVTVAFDISSGTSPNRVMYDLIDNNKIIWSADGETWVNSTISDNRNWTKIKYLNNGFYALNTNNEIYFSVDGKTNWNKVIITIAEEQFLQYSDFATSGLVLVFLTKNNKVVVTGIDVSAQTFNANARILNIIDNLSFNDMDVNSSGQIVISGKQSKIMVSPDNGSNWQIKNIDDIDINRVKFFDNKFFLLSNLSYNRIVYSGDLFNSSINYITQNNFDYVLIDIIYVNSKYYFLINSGDKRIIKSTKLTEVPQENLFDYFEFKNSIKDIYNAWIRYDNLSINENVKNRCLINNNKINL
jgi:hypothetical protein